MGYLFTNNGTISLIEHVGGEIYYVRMSLNEDSCLDRCSILLPNGRVLHLSQNKGLIILDASELASLNKESYIFIWGDDFKVEDIGKEFGELKDPTQKLIDCYIRVLNNDGNLLTNGGIMSQIVQYPNYGLYI